MQLLKGIILTEEQCAEGLEQIEKLVGMRTSSGCVILDKAKLTTVGDAVRRHRTKRFRVRLKRTYGKRWFNPKRLAYAIANDGILEEGQRVGSICNKKNCVAGKHLRAWTVVMTPVVKEATDGKHS